MDHYALFDEIKCKVHKDQVVVDIKPFILEPLSLDNGFLSFFNLVRSIEYIVDHPRSETDMILCQIVIDEHIRDILTTIKCVVCNQDQIRRIMLNMKGIDMLQHQIPYFENRIRRLDAIDALYSQRSIKQPLAFDTLNDQLNLMHWRERLDNGLAHWMTLTIIMNVCSDPKDIVIEYVRACGRELQNRLKKRELDPPKRSIRAVYKTVWLILCTLIEIRTPFTCSPNGYVMNVIKGMICAAPRPHHSRCRFCGEKKRPRCSQEALDFDSVMMHFDAERVRGPDSSIKRGSNSLHVSSAKQHTSGAAKTHV